MLYPFIVGKKYSRAEVKLTSNAPDPYATRGFWYTGCVLHEKAFFIFANVGIAGVTGHDYANFLIDDCLYWISSKTYSYDSPMIQKLISNEYEKYIFTRTDKGHFTFNGLGYVRDVGIHDVNGVNIVWGIVSDVETIPNEYKLEVRKRFIEGVRTETLVTRYERNPKARQACLNHWGYSCVVCYMNFSETYGEIGDNFIHVHHLKEIASIGEAYVIDPVNDLRPVCPNCHAMLHRRRPAYTIEELNHIVEDIRSSRVY